MAKGFGTEFIPIEHSGLHCLSPVAAIGWIWSANCWRMCHRRRPGSQGTGAVLEGETDSLSHGQFTGPLLLQGIPGDANLIVLDRAMSPAQRDIGDLQMEIGDLFRCIEEPEDKEAGMVSLTIPPNKPLTNLFSSPGPWAPLDGRILSPKKEQQSAMLVMSGVSFHRGVVSMVQRHQCLVLALSGDICAGNTPCFSLLPGPRLLL